MVGPVSEALRQWAEDQRALARALGLSLDDWLAALDAAGRNRAGLTAAVIGASMARKRGIPNLGAVNGPELATRARALIDPEPPRTEHPVLAEAIRRSQDLQTGEGARRLGRSVVARPDRVGPSTAPSAAEATADAPGDDS